LAAAQTDEPRALLADHDIETVLIGARRDVHDRARARHHVGHDELGEQER
jgi:hypothetical protein